MRPLQARSLEALMLSIVLQTAGLRDDHVQLWASKYRQTSPARCKQAICNNLDSMHTGSCDGCSILAFPVLQYGRILTVWSMCTQAPHPAHAQGTWTVSLYASCEASI